MKNIMNSSAVFEDIWMNTQVALDDDAEAEDISAVSPWSRIEEANFLLNPDYESMESRG